MMRERLIIVGNGMAGLRVVEEVVKRCPHRFMTTVIGAEPEPAYNRVLLSTLLAGEIGEPDVALKPRSWYGANRINLTTGETVTGIDTAARRVRLSGGQILPFDHLVLATGSSPFRLPVPGHDLDGVMAFRTLADVERMRAATGRVRHAVVIGGGLLGVEAAYGLARAGVPVTLLHLMDRLMERQLDAEAAARLKIALEARGIVVRLGAKTDAIEGKRWVESVRLGDGSIIPCAAVVMAVGIVPNSGLAKQAGLEVGRGIKVDDQLRTSVPRVYAAGECAEHRGNCYGWWSRPSSRRAYWRRCSRARVLPIQVPYSRPT
jgi:nitrite reductase (NADH) large subunit